MSTLWDKQASSRIQKPADAVKAEPVVDAPAKAAKPKKAAKKAAKKA